MAAYVTAGLRQLALTSLPSSLAAPMMGAIDQGMVVSSSVLPAHSRVSPVSPRLQTVLDSTGTVTDLLSAMFGETVQALRIHSVRCAEILSRSAVLLGSRSGRQFCFAHAEIDLGADMAALVRMVEEEGFGIGQALNRLGLPQARCIEAVWHEDEHAFSDVFTPVRSGGFAVRRYTIAVAGRPAIRICERFPLAAFGTPAAHEC